MSKRIKRVFGLLTFTAIVGGAIAVGIPSIASATIGSNTSTCYEQVPELQYQKQTREHRRESVEAEWGAWTEWSWWTPASYKWSASNVEVLEGPAPHGGEPNGTYYREYRYVQNGQTRTVNGAEKPCPVPNNPSATVNYICVDGDEPLGQLALTINPDLDPLASWTLSVPDLGLEFDGTDTSFSQALLPVPVGSYGWSLKLYFEGYDVTLSGTFQVTDDCMPDKLPIPATPAQNDPCGVNNASWIVQLDTADLDWTLREDGHLVVSTKGGKQFTDDTTTKDFGLAVDSGVLCGTTDEHDTL